MYIWLLWNLQHFPLFPKFRSWVWMLFLSSYYRFRFHRPWNEIKECSRTPFAPRIIQLWTIIHKRLFDTMLLCRYGNLLASGAVTGGGVLGPWIFVHWFKHLWNRHLILIWLECMHYFVNTCKWFWCPVAPECQVLVLQIHI